MRSYTLTEAYNQYEQVLEVAVVEPVLLTKRSQPSHVIISFDTYKFLMERMAKLEDTVLSQGAAILDHSDKEGMETVTDTHNNAANGLS